MHFSLHFVCVCGCDITQNTRLSIPSNATRRFNSDKSAGGGAENARLENAELENAAPNCRTGKRETGKRENGLVM